MTKDRMEGGSKRPEPPGEAAVLVHTRQQKRAEERRQWKKVMKAVGRLTKNASK